MATTSVETHGVEELPRRGTRAATRADVARQAGVSTAVVSYVVNEGPRRVAPETAARVRAAVDALQYRPNGNARALSRGSTEMIGLVVPDIENAFFAELARAVEQAASRHGLLLLVANSDADLGKERRIVEEMANRHVDGILLCTMRTPAAMRSAPVPGRPTVLINNSSAIPGYPALGPAARKGSYALVDHLIRVHGHQSVALIMGASNDSVPEPREAGWADAFRVHGLPPGPIVRTTFNRRGGYEAMREALSWSTPPRAVFVASDQQCAGALRAIREAGLECPTDVAMVGYDGTEDSEYCWPPLTVARQPIAAMAEAALLTVLDPEHAPDFQQFDTELVIRSSCGC